MRHLFFFLLTALLLGVGCQPSSSPAGDDDQVLQYTIEQFMDNESLGGGSFSPDGSRILITSNRSGVYNVYTIPVDGGEPTALTASDSTSVWAVSFFPDDERVLLRMDDNGNEVFHLFRRDTDGTVTDLTPNPEARAVFYGWAHDKQSFFYGYNQRDPRFMDVYEMPLATFEPVMIYQNDAGYEFGGISNNKQFMALTKSINTNDSDLFLYNLESGEIKKINTSQAGHSVADFSVDSKSLFYLTDEGSEFQYLVRYDMESENREEVMKRDWDIWYATFSYNGKYRIVGVNEDGQTVVEVTNMETGQAVAFPEFPNGDITSVSIPRSEDQMAFYVGSSSSPSNLYVYDFASGEYKKLTDTLNPEIDPDDLVTAEVVRYPSFDGVEIPAIYYKPKQASADNKVSALVWVHGGPGGQSRQSYFPLIQYLVNHGYAILAVNNRGSSGYGKTFYQMDDRNHGEGDLRDCIYGKQWLAQQDYIDGEEIGIIGGSYGGFMVMRAMTATPEEFAVGVDIFGVTNWLRTLQSIPPWWESFKDALYTEMGDPAVDSVRLYNISPVFHGDQVKNPVMVLQGAQDPRVLKIESDEMVEAIRAQDVPVEYVLFEDEGHGFVKKENEIEAYGKILEFLDKYLDKDAEMKG